MLVYDITNEKSFENIRNWVRNIEEVISLFTYWIIKDAISSSKSSWNLIASEALPFFWIHVLKGAWKINWMKTRNTFWNALVNSSLLCWDTRASRGDCSPSSHEGTEKLMFSWHNKWSKSCRYAGHAPGCWDEGLEGACKSVEDAWHSMLSPWCAPHLFDNICLKRPKPKSFDLFLSQHASPDVEKMILGNKCDANDKRQVSREQGEKVSAVALMYFSLDFLEHKTYICYGLYASLVPQWCS